MYKNFYLIIRGLRCNTRERKICELSLDAHSRRDAFHSQVYFEHIKFSMM